MPSAQWSVCVWDLEEWALLSGSQPSEHSIADIRAQQMLIRKLLCIVLRSNSPWTETVTVHKAKPEQRAVYHFNHQSPARPIVMETLSHCLCLLLWHFHSCTDSLSLSPSLSKPKSMTVLYLQFEGKKADHFWPLIKAIAVITVWQQLSQKPLDLMRH